MSSTQFNDDFGGGESEEEDFNPAPAVDSDDEENVQSSRQQAPSRNGSQPASNSNRQEAKRPASPAKDDEDDDGELELDEETEDRPTTKKANANANDDDENEDDEDDDEEDEDEEGDDEVSARSRKRRRRDPRNQYIEIEAEVDDDDEEEGDEDEEGGPGEEVHPDDLLPAGADKDDRAHRELDRQRELASSMDAEQQARELKERYGRNRVAASDSAVVPQRLLLPSVDDPSIWRLKCKPGKERDVVYQVIKRIEERAMTREPVQIISAFERGGVMSGYLYVEARTLAQVLSGLDGIQNVYMGSKAMLIPINEMPDLLKVRKTKELEIGMYVRMKRGKYSGDLAQIDDVEVNGAEVTVRIVPRLDYGLNEEINAFENGSIKRKRAGGFGTTAGAVRPAPRLFSETEAKKKHGRFLTMGSGLSGRSWIYMKDEYHDGFLIKKFKTSHLVDENVNPTLEEVTRFARENDIDGAENLDLSALAATIKGSTAAAFLPGDSVEIYEGEQRGVIGKAVSVTGDIVRVAVSEGLLQGQIVETPVKGLRKLFREGDHVKVIGGSKYFDEVGMVVKIRDEQVTILTDSTNIEITVFSKDLRVATDSGGQLGFSKYDLHDLVQLDAATVGVVIKVDRESLRVLDQTGTVRSLLPSQVSNKLERRKDAVATDRDGAEIRLDDTIKEYGVDNRTGRVLHIHRNFLFAHNREQLDNAGVFVVRTANVVTVAAKGRSNGAMSSLQRMNPAAQKPGAPTPMAPPRSMGRDKLIGKTVAPKRGPYKGLVGIVIDAQDDTVRVELHTKKNVLSIKREDLTIRDPNTGAVISNDARKLTGGMVPSSMMTGRPGGSYGGAMPSGPGNARGNDGGRTPAWATNSGGRTPAWASGGRTAYGGGGGRTPRWAGAGSGGQTAYGGGQTAYGGHTAYGGQTSYGGATPFGGAGGASGGGGTSYGGTTAYGGGTSYGGTTYEAPTPGTSYQTPGYSAPTPGDSSTSTAYYATTPGASGYGNAPTPGASHGLDSNSNGNNKGDDDDAPGYD